MSEDSASLWSWVTFSFVDPIFKVANSRTLNEEDCWSLSPFFQHRNLFKKYLEYFEKYACYCPFHVSDCSQLDIILQVSSPFSMEIPTRDKLPRLDHQRLTGYILRVCRYLRSFLKFVQRADPNLGFIPPYALQRILAALADPTPESKMTAYIFSIITFAVHLSFANQDVFKGWHSRRAYERARGQLFCALHYKSVVLITVSPHCCMFLTLIFVRALKRRDVCGSSNKQDDENGSADLGKVVNLMQFRIACLSRLICV